MSYHRFFILTYRPCIRWTFPGHVQGGGRTLKVFRGKSFKRKI